MRGTYARARVVVIRYTVARTLLWTGGIGAAAGAALPPQLLDRGQGALLGAGLCAVGLLLGLLPRLRWHLRQAEAAQRTSYAVTLEPPQETRRRFARGTALTWLVGICATGALGLVAGPAAGLLVFGYGLGVLLNAWRLARYERSHELLLWAATDDGRLLRRRSRLTPFTQTGPAADKVRPVVRGAAPTRR